MFSIFYEDYFFIFKKLQNKEMRTILIARYFVPSIRNKPSNNSVNNNTMRTTLSVAFALLCTSLFAQNTDSLSTGATTELVVGFNNTSVTARNAYITNAHGDNGYQIGILRKYSMGKRSAFSFGMNVMSVKHQVAFTGKTVAFEDKGIRAYNNLYFRVPLDWTFTPKANRPFFMSAGLNLSSALQNRSTEAFLRTSFMDDAGARFEKPVEKTFTQYREVATLDLGVRVGGGMTFKFNKTVFSASAYYNQGLLNKDMGFRQRQIEFQLGMTIPQIKRTQRDMSRTPAVWLD